MIYLHKLLPLIASPLGLVVFLIITGICWRRWWMITLSCFVLLLSSLPVTAQFIWQDLEKQYSPKTLSDFGSFDAVVVLSGMLSPFEYNGNLHVEWVDPDRFFAGIDVPRGIRTVIILPAVSTPRLSGVTSSKRRPSVTSSVTPERTAA